MAGNKKTPVWESYENNAQKILHNRTERTEQTQSPFLIETGYQSATRIENGYKLLKGLYWVVRSGKKLYQITHN